MTQTSYIDNYRQDVKTEIGTFSLEQKNCGFAVNTGEWIVTQYQETFWSLGGILKERRPAKFLGTFATEALAREAIATAELQPEHATPRWCGYTR